MQSHTDQLRSLILSLAWQCLHRTNPALKSAGWQIVFPNEEEIQKAAGLCELEFAPGLFDVFQSPTPPTLSFFQSLPLPALRLWAVYVVILFKLGQWPRIYIGSATDSLGSILRRMGEYDRRVRTGKASTTIPHHVERSLQEGYTILHKGLLAWTSVPPASRRYLVRCLFLLMETLFTLCFWAMISRTKDYYMPALGPWPRDSFTYHGLCTHFSINEGLAVNEFPSDLTPEEIDRLDLERRQEKNRMHIANKGEGVHAANTKQYGDKALEEQRYKCTVCDLTFRSKAKLLQHEARPIHIQKAAGIPPPVRGRGGSQNARRTKKHWCEICQHAAASAKRLETHLKGARHAKKLRDLELAAKLD